MPTRKDFWAHNADTVALMLAKVPDLDGLTVILADTQDIVGGGLVRAVAEAKGQDIQADLDKLASKGVPTGMMLLPTNIVVEVLRESNPKIAYLLSELTPPARAIWVVVIADGGSMLLATPLPNRNEVIGQA
jgi:hypothetical protein